MESFPRRSAVAATACVVTTLFAGRVIAQDTESSPVASPKKIAETLHDLSARYGRDAALLEVLLLGNAVRGGARLATEVQIVGHEERAGRRHLFYRVETGMLFDTNREDRRRRVDAVWERVVARSLQGLEHFQVDAEGLTIDLGYGHVPDPDSLSLRRDLRGAQLTERLRVHLLRADWEDFIAKKATPEELFDRIAKEVDGEPYRPRAQD